MTTVAQESGEYRYGTMTQRQLESDAVVRGCVRR